MAPDPSQPAGSLCEAKQFGPIRETRAVQPAGPQGEGRRGSVPPAASGRRAPQPDGPRPVPGGPAPRLRGFGPPTGSPRAARRK